jgi:hypothetical protein
MSHKYWARELEVEFKLPNFKAHAEVADLNQNLLIRALGFLSISSDVANW